jgi:ribosomal protein S18 acetylase RimI-like enzyme
VADRRSQDSVGRVAVAGSPGSGAELEDFIDFVLKAKKSAKYSDADQEGIAALLRAHDWAERYVAGQLAAAANLAASETGAAFVATADGSVAGFVSVECHSWNGLAQLQGLAVHPEQLRRRVGARLVEAAESVARERGCRGIYVDTPVDNEGGRDFYAAQGFLEDYRMSRYYSDELDGVTYVKFFR